MSETRDSPNQEIKKLEGHEIEKIKHKFYVSNAPTKAFQMDLTSKLKILLDDLFAKYAEGKTVEIEDINQTAKNLISLTDKMRKQDEGIKITQDIHLDHDRFRKICDAEARILEENEEDERRSQDAEHKKKRPHQA